MGATENRELDTTGGKLPLVEYILNRGDRQWSVLHTGALLTRTDEAKAISSTTNRLPYGVSLWPSAIALAHEISHRADAFREVRVLELGAGVGLPGIVAAALGAEVVQTDRDELALHLCQCNGTRNRISTATYRLADWTTWDDPGQYDWIVGSDILYGESLLPHLRRIFATNLSPTGQVLLADPFRSTALRFFETLEIDGWNVTFSRWNVGAEAADRAVGVFLLCPPRRDVGETSA